LPWIHLKYADESHFDSRDLHRTRGWSPSSQRVQLTIPSPNTARYSLTLLTNLANPNGFYVGSIRQDNNDALDFLDFIVDIIEKKQVVAGDILIVDNASIHTSQEIFPVVMALLRGAHVRLCLLPAYSPEYQPCELIFASVKNYLRRKRGTLPLFYEIILAFQTVRYDQILGMYQNCIIDVLK